MRGCEGEVKRKMKDVVGWIVGVVDGGGIMEVGVRMVGKSGVVGVVVGVEVRMIGIKIIVVGRVGCNERVWGWVIVEVWGIGER